MHLFHITQIKEEIWDRKNLRMLNTQEKYVITLKIKDSANTETPASSNTKEETIDQTEEIKTRDNFNSERRNDKRNGPHYNNEKNFLEEIRSMMGGQKGHDQYTEAGSSKSHASSEPGSPKSPLPNCISSRPRSTVLAHGSTRYNVLRGKGEPRRKKVRRGVKRNKSISGSKKCQVLYVNINGYKSKMESVKQLLEELDIDLVMLAETKVYSAASIDIKGFQAFPVTRSRNKSGGLYIGIRHGFCQSVLIDEGDNAEFISVRLCSQPSSIRLILSDGPQEKESENKRTDFYESLSIQIQRAQMEGNMVVLVGDFNAELGSDVIKGDIHSMSKNGQLLWDVIKTFNLEVINSADIYRGVFTRIKATKKKIEKSVLDYVIVSNQFKDQFLSCLIDEDKQLTP